MRCPQRLAHGLAAACLAAAVGASGAALPLAAGAAPAVAATSAAGSYNTSLDLEGAKLTPTLKLSAGGSFAFTGFPVSGTWSHAGASVTLKGTLSSKPIVFTAKLSGKHLGTKKDPGLITIKGIALGTWYATKR